MKLVSVAGAFAVLSLGALALSGCVNNMVPPCPEVRVDSTTARLTQFKEGAGRDITDVQYQAEVLSYQGQCDYRDDGVTVEMDLAFAIATGAAVKPGPTSIYYFVAIPQMFPKPEAKRVFELKYNLPATPGVRSQVRENGLKVFIPLKKDEPGASYDVYVGLQLNNEQLNYNRSQNQK
ncbi:MAG: hypothetical protein JNM81_16595 [Rhodospirillaceae bacterium]|nr:hypothetical protein [Rhodospirillaceae bacterium]